MGRRKGLKRNKPQEPKSTKVQQLSQNSPSTTSDPSLQLQNLFSVCSPGTQMKGSTSESSGTQELSFQPWHSSQPGPAPLRHTTGSIPLSASPVCGLSWAWREGAVGREGAGAIWEGEARLGAPSECQTGWRVTCGKRQACAWPNWDAWVLRRAAGSRAGV